MTHSETSCTPTGAALWASASPAIREAWFTWQRHADAWQDAEGRSDTVTATSERRRADDAALRLIAIPSASMNDVAPKTFVAAWVRCHRADDGLLAIIEDTVEAETLALQPPILVD